MKYSAKLLVTTSLALAAVVPFAAQAQEEETFQLEEVVVTARLRQEKLQTTPLAITAVKGDKLDEKGIRDVRGLLAQAPNVYYSNQGGEGNGSVTMRGLTQSASIGDETNVVAFVDGFHLAGRFGFEAFVDNLERVEIIRGPQSALYGRSAFSGAINYVTKKPDMQEFHGGGKVTYGTEGKREYGINVTGPIATDKAAIRLDYTHNETGGSYKNQSTGERLGDSNSENFRGALRVTPTENLTLDYAFTRTERHTSMQPLWITAPADRDLGMKWDASEPTYFVMPPGVPGFPAAGLNQVAGAGAWHYMRAINTQPVPVARQKLFDFPGSGSDYKVNRHQFKIDWQSEQYQLSLLASASNEDFRSVTDANYGLGGLPLFGMVSKIQFQAGPTLMTIPIPTTMVSLTTNGTHSDKLETIGGAPNQSRKDKAIEFRVQSKYDGPINFIAGAYHSELKYTNATLISYVANETQAAQISGAAQHKQFFGMPPSVPFGTYIFPFDKYSATDSRTVFMSSYTTTFDPQPFQKEYHEDTDTSIFGSVRGAFGNFEVQLEGRYSWEKRYMNELENVGQMFAGVMYPPLPAGALAPKTFKVFTPRLFVDYKMSDQVFLYAAMAKGAKAGGVQSQAPVAPMTPNKVAKYYEPETNWTYEAGTKLSFLNNHLNVAISAFYVDWTNMQIRANTGLQNEISNLGKVESKGFEVEAQWRVHRNVQMRFGYSMTDSTIKKGNDAQMVGFCDMPDLAHALKPLSRGSAVALKAGGAALQSICKPLTSTGADATALLAADTSITNGEYFANLSTGDISGNRMPLAPKHTFTYGVDVNIPVTDTVKVFISSDLNYRSKIFVDRSNYSSLGDTVEVNAQAGIANDNYRLSFWVANLTQEDTPVAVIRNFNALGQELWSVQHREGRKWGVTLSGKF